MHPPVEELSAFVRAELRPLTALVDAVVDDPRRADAIARSALATVCAQPRAFSHDRPELCARRVALRAAIRRARRRAAFVRSRARRPGARARAARALAGEGRAVDEIADVLECTPAAVRRLLRRAPGPDGDRAPLPLPPTPYEARALVEGGRRGGRARAAGAGALVAVSVAAGSIAGLPESWRVRRPTDEPGPRVVAPLPRGVVAVRVGYGPRSVVAAFGSVWVVSQWVRPGTVTRIDPAANEVVTEIGVGRQPQAAVAADGSMWVAVSRPPSVVRVDPGRERVTARIPLESPPLSLAAGHGSLWVGTETHVARLDPRTGRVRARIPASFAAALAVVGDEVWVANLSGATVTRIDAARERVVGVTPVRGLGAAMLAAYGEVWIARGHDLLRLDPRSGRAAGTVPLGAPAGGLAAADGAVWIASANRAVRVDPATGEVDTELPAGSGAEFGIALAHGDVWIANHNDASVWRVDADP